MIKFIIVCILALVSYDMPTYAQSTLILQEKCVERAKQFLLQLDTPAANKGHYSKKLDGCFLSAVFLFGEITEEVKLPDGNTKTQQHRHKMQALYNVLDGKMVGSYEIIGPETLDCWVGTKRCNTIDEFESLEKPYLEE